MRALHAVLVALAFVANTTFADEAAPLPSRLSQVPTPMPADRDPCALFTPDADYVTQTIIMEREHRRVQMRVPKVYFEDAWDRVDGFEDTAQLFSVEIGTMLPVSRPETGRRNTVGIWNWMDFVTRDSKPLEEISVLHATTWNRGSTYQSLTEFARLPGPFALSEIVSDGRPLLKGFRSNYYISENSSAQLHAFLECDEIGNVPSPGCQMFLRSGGMDVEVGFRRTELPNWEKIKQDVDQFLVCAISDDL
jgi:hypothetical protein